MLTIQEAKAPATESEIHLLDRLFNATAPGEYRSFLLNQNGCTVAMAAKGWHDLWELRFLSIAEVLETYPLIEQFYYSWGKNAEPGSFCHIPIATNDNSDYLAYVLWQPIDDSYPIYQIDHDDYPFFKGHCERFRRANNLLDLWTQFESGSFSAF